MANVEWEHMLTSRMYSFPVRVKSCPAMLMVISGKVGIKLQSIVYCNDHKQYHHHQYVNYGVMIQMYAVRCIRVTEWNSNNLLYCGQRTKAVLKITIRNWSAIY